MPPSSLEKENRALREEIRDINARHETAVAVLKQAERKLVESLAVSEESNRCKAQLIAELSHEMRTPLGALVGFSNLLMRQNLDPKAKSQAANIHEASLYLLELVKDLACEDAGDIKLEIAVADAPQILKSCLPLVEEQARKAQVALDLDIAADFPPIRTDPRRLKQVILNLVGNAIKFTKPGGKVSVKAFVKPKEGAFIVVISDTGIGMKPGQAEAAMEAGLETEQAAPRKGLGLPITMRIVESLGGTLSFRSNPGEGTVVTLQFPDAVVSQDD